MDMDIIFDRAKDVANISKHGLSLADAAKLDWETALVWTDTRYDYREERQAALAALGRRVFFVGFVDRLEGRRIITLRKANTREVKRYVAAND